MHKSIQILTAVIVLSVNLNVHASPLIPGDLTPGFGGGDGRQYLPTTWSDEVAVAAFPDGSYVAAIDTLIGGTPNAMGLAKFHRDGSLDTTYGTNGYSFAPPEVFEQSRAIVALPGGGVAVAGHHWNGSNRHFTVARFDAKGKLDNGFGNGGIASFPVGNDGFLNAIAVDNRGRLVVAGGTITGTNVDIALARLTPLGVLDADFGNGGIVTARIGNRDNAFSDVIVLPDDRIAVTGGETGSNPNAEMLVGVYRVDGTPDPGFSGDGLAFADWGGVYDQASSIISDSIGRLVVAGASIVGGTYDFVAARFLQNGDLDADYGGGDGIVTVDFGSLDVVTDAVLQADGKLIMAGSSSVTLSCPWALTRLTVDGQLDPTFGDDGRVLIPMSTDNWCIYPNSILRLPQGHLLVGGSAYAGATHNFAAVDVFVGPGVIGDANGDCLVGTADYAQWAAQFGQTGFLRAADFDASGDVGAGDYSLWAANFGNSCAEWG